MQWWALKGTLAVFLLPGQAGRMSELETVVSGEAAEGGAVERGYVSGGEGDSAQGENFYES